VAALTIMIAATTPLGCTLLDHGALTPLGTVGLRPNVAAVSSAQQVPSTSNTVGMRPIFAALPSALPLPSTSITVNTNLILPFRTKAAHGAYMANDVTKVILKLFVQNTGAITTRDYWALDTPVFTESNYVWSAGVDAGSSNHTYTFSNVPISATPYVVTGQAQNGTGNITKADALGCPTALYARSTNWVTIPSALGAAVYAGSPASSPLSLAIPLQDATTDDVPINTTFTDGAQPTIGHLDLTPGTVLGTYAVGSNPTGVAAGTAGTARVCNNLGDSVTMITATGAITGPFSVGAGNHPRAIVLDSAGNAWTANNGGNNVSKITLAGVVTGPFAVGTNPLGIAYDGVSRTWTCNQGSGNVSRISSAGAVSSFAVGATPIAIAIDSGSNAWSCSNSDNKVYKVTSGGVISGPFVVANDPEAIAVDAARNAWTANTTSNSVSKVTSAGVVSGAPFPVTVGNGPVKIAIDSAGNAWTANQAGNSVSKISPTGVISGPFALGASPNAIAIDPTGNVWLTVGTSPGAVYRVTPTGTVSGPFIVGNGPTALVIDVLAHIWVVNTAGNSVTLLQD
jgi:streptogramin lyase